ncbi:MAG: ABC transporter ATP-binding protein [Firmicutes bacterium]|nr:ABC transporter ATP-binding protein [Bacillota bacterium]
MPVQTPLILLQHVFKIYHEGTENEVRALNDVSFRVQEGEFVAIVGQSGSGKSTLMNCIGCLDQPTRGTYQFRGTGMERCRDSFLSRVRNREIGFIFQGFNLIAGLTAEENVEMPLVYRGFSRPERQRRAREALCAVGLEQRMNHRPQQLSGGQQQRVAIARAIAAEPSLLLADEPTGNLDSRAGSEIVKLLHRLHRSGKTILLITHDGKVARAAQRMVEIRDGRIVGDHPVKDAASAF